MFPSKSACSARPPAAASGAPDRFEAEDVEFHQELRDAYRQIAAAEPQRCVLIDANADADTVAASVWAALRERLFAAATGDRGQFGMSARQVEPQITVASPRETTALVRPSRSRAGVAERLSQRAHSACLADRRTRRASARRRWPIGWRGSCSRIAIP